MVKYLDLKKINDSFEPELSEAVAQVVRSGWYLFGKEVETFEQRFESLLGPREACPTQVVDPSATDKGWSAYRPKSGRVSQFANLRQFVFFEVKADRFGSWRTEFHGYVAGTHVPIGRDRHQHPAVAE